MSAAPPKNNVDAWHRESMRKLERELQRARHIRTIERIRADGKRRRRAEEQSTLRFRESTVKHKRTMLTKFGQGEGASIEELRRRERVIRGTHGFADPRAAGWRAHFEGLCRAAGIEVSYDALPASNAYAFATLKRLETQPIIDEESLIVAHHEYWHVRRPCESTHRPVKTTSGRECCIRCELNAWAGAISSVPIFTRGMHNEISHCLPTYRQHATAQEQSEIDRLCSDDGYRRAKLDAPLPWMRQRMNT